MKPAQKRSYVMRDGNSTTGMDSKRKAATRLLQEWAWIQFMGADNLDVKNTIFSQFIPATGGYHEFEITDQHLICIRMMHALQKKKPVRYYVARERFRFNVSVTDIAKKLDMPRRKVDDMIEVTLDLIALNCC